MPAQEQEQEPMSENRHVPRRRRAACSVQWSRLWLGFYTVPLDARDGCATDSWAVFRRSSRDVPIAESAPALSPHPPYRLCRHRGKGNVTSTTSVVRLSLVASDGPVGSASSCHRHHTVVGCCGKTALFTDTVFADHSQDKTQVLPITAGAERRGRTARGPEGRATAPHAARAPATDETGPETRANTTPAASRQTSGT